MWFQNFKRSFLYKLTVAFLLSLTLLTTFAPAVQPVHAQLATDQVNNDNFYKQFKPTCGLGSLTGGSLVGCIAQLIYFVFYKIPAIFASLTGMLMDFFIGYSIDSNSYNGGEDSEYGVGNSIQNAWVTVRNIANIFFILLLLYTAIATIFNISGVNYKTIVPAIILNALLINFSLFVTKAMIDLSNITAHVFYNQIVVENPETQAARVGVGGYTSISEGIVAGYQPQRVLAGALAYTQDPNKLFAWMKALQTDLTSDILSPEEKLARYNELRDALVKERFIGSDKYLLPPLVELAKMTEDQLRTEATRIINGYGSAIVEHVTSSTGYAGTFILVSILAGAISFVTGLMFFKVSFVFLGRVIGFYIAMIFSPFAFMSRKLPFVGNVDRLGWVSWVGAMFKNMVVAPLFIFFIFIIYRLLTSDFYQNNFILPASGFISTLIAVTIPMLIIYGLINAAEKATLKYANEFSTMATNILGTVAGTTLGVASGGLALAGTRFGSRIGKAVGKSGLGKWAAKNADTNLLARLTNKGLSATQTGSWDLRRTAVGGALQKNPLYEKMGIKVEDKLTSNKYGKYLGLGKERFEGGYKGQQKRRQKKIKENIEKRIDYNHLSDEQAKVLWQKKINDEFGEKEKIDQKQIELLNDLGQKLKEGQGFMKAAADELEARRRSGAITGYTKADVETLAKQNQAQWKQSNQQLTSKYEEFTKEKGQKYGKVENAKDLTNAMRRNYAEDLRNNSIWMKDGKQRKGLPASGAAYGGASGATVGAAVGTAAAITGGVIGGSIAAERLKFEQEALDAATKAYIKGYGKNKGKNKIDQYKAKLNEIEEKIKNFVAEALNKSVDQLTEADLAEQRTHLKTKVDDLQEEFDLKDTIFKKKQREYQAGAGDNPYSQEELKRASKERKRAEDRLNEAKNLWKNKEETEEKIGKEEEAESKKKEKDDEKK